MSTITANGQSPRNYPDIQIDRGSVIRPFVADQAAPDPFIDKPVSGWRRLVHDIRHEGLAFILKYGSNLTIPTNCHPYYAYLIKALRYIAILMLHIHSVYLYLYGYFYPYSLMSLDQVCDEFSPCPKWSESVIRAFAWHPSCDRCALAVCNDYIYIYEGSTRIRVLHHNHQRKIVDLLWHPTNKEILVVATQNHIVFWRIADSKTNPALKTYLAPGVNLIKRDKTSQMPASQPEFKILDNVLPPPIISLQFDGSGAKLYAASPNSSKIAVLTMDTILKLDSFTAKTATTSTTTTNTTSSAAKTTTGIEYIQRFGCGVTKLLWSPAKDRLATATTSSFFRVYEPFKWSCNKWPSQSSIIQDMAWTKPSGRMLLLANKSEPSLYVLPFLDTPAANDVGGNKSLMRALDLSVTKSDQGDFVGGRVQSFAWDKNGLRLAISFKDNPRSIILYRTVEKPTAEFHQMGLVQNENGCHPLLMRFHDNYRSGSLLTICWSDGSCQHIPFCYTPQEQAKNDGTLIDDGFIKSADLSINNAHNPNSPPKTPRTPRSLTNFCQVSSSLIPTNKVQNHTTLYSLSPSG